MSANTEWLLSVRGKLGWIGWNTLWYVTGGGAWVNTEFTATIQVLAQAAGPNIPNPYQAIPRSTRPRAVGYSVAGDPFNDARAPTRGRVERRGRVWRFFGCANLVW